jgi:DNA-binding NarL/FixJ family response regulator
VPVDDQPDQPIPLRRLAGLVLTELKRDATILEASSCSQAMQIIAAHADLHLVLLDLNLPDRDGFSMLAEIAERYPATSVVVLWFAYQYVIVDNEYFHSSDSSVSCLWRSLVGANLTEV